MARKWNRLAASIAGATMLVGFVPVDGPQAVSGDSRVIVSAATAEAASDAVVSHGGSTVTELELIDAVVAEVPSAQVDRLASDPRVQDVTSDYTLQMQSDSFGGAPAGTYPSSIGAEQVRKQGLDGTGVGIALLDTGVTPHQDIDSAVVASADLTDEGSFVDSFGHGTFLAGLIAGDGSASNGRFTGVSPGAHLMSVKVAGADGETTLGRVLYGLQLIDYSKDSFDLDVVVMALAGPASEGPDPLELAVDRLWADGLVVVLPSGNQGPNLGTVATPGVDPYAITVGGVDEQGTANPSDDVVAEWSAAGPTADGIQKPDFVAPGAHVVSLRSPGSTIDSEYASARMGEMYFRGSGTSMSAAVTAGAAALLLQSDPSLTPDEVKGRLMYTATPIADGEDPVRFGTGEVDVVAAVTSDAPEANSDIPRLKAEKVTAPGDANGKGKKEKFDWIVDDSGMSYWAGRAWAGRAWAGRAWAGRAWAGRAWAEFDWSGRAWADSEWAGRAWAGRAWAGRAWAGRAWAGRAWAGRAWAGRAWANYGWASEGWD